MKHVKAYKDDARPYHEMSFDGKKNTNCDVAEKEAICRIEKGEYKILKFREETKAIIFLEEGGLKEDPYAWCMNKLAEEVLPKRLKLHENQFRMID